MKPEKTIKTVPLGGLDKAVEPLLETTGLIRFVPNKTDTKEETVMKEENENKPWWHGKKCKDMEGLRVHVVFKSGMEATDVLDHNGDMNMCGSFPLIVSSGYGDDDFVPTDSVKSIELVEDEPEYERIDRIEDVCAGDIFVCKNGNRFQVREADTEEHTCNRIRVSLMPNACVDAWLLDSAFDHARREKPQVPTHDGIWQNRRGNLLLASDDSRNYVRVGGKWMVGAHFVRKEDLRYDAPWTEWHGDDKENA